MGSDMLASLEPVRDASPIVPGPMGTNQGVERLMFPDALDDGVSGRLVVAALDVEVAQEGLEDQGGQEGNPSFQQVDESGVGAKLLEQRCGEASLKEPCTVSRLSGNPHGLTVRDDVHQCIQGRLGGFVEDSLVTVCPCIDGLQGGHGRLCQTGGR